MKIKMKSLLEGFAWERTSGKPLPTLADVARKHRQNLKEADLDSLVGATGAAGAAAGAEALAGASEDGGTNVVSKKFDLILKEKMQFQKVKEIFGKVSIIKQVDFVLYLLDTLGMPDDAKKKLKMKL
jgi:hypothetical protein|tara:strand:- start:2479 stop:2859 length:381 start_codon:yes stop_codon:yes gene_type:complete